MDHGNDILMASMLMALYGDRALWKAQVSRHAATVDNDLDESARWARVEEAVRRMQPRYVNQPPKFS
jgi:hypothetical protein